MRGYGRRALLRVLAASPFGAQALVEQAKGAAAGIAVSGLGSANGSGAVPSASGAPLSFADFASWFAKVGHHSIRREARYVTSLDPELVEMRLPLATKVRMQRERNYRRLVAERKDWFSEQLSAAGIVQWWP